LSSLFVVVTAVSIYYAYRTNQQAAKYYTPAPVAAYDPDIIPYDFGDKDFVYPLDPRLAAVQLRERVKAIADRIAELRSRGETDRADEMQAALDEILANREGPYPLDGEEQLHVIGLYDGGDPKDTVNKIDGHDVGESHVRITYTKAPLIVCFCAYDPVRWVVEVAPDVQLKRVILGGYYSQQVQGLPEGVPIEGQVEGGRRPAYSFYACRAIEAPRAAKILKELTGLDATTFLATHEYRGAPFGIGPGDSEWTAKMTLHALESLYQEAVREKRTKLAKELVKHTFPEIAFSARNRYGDAQGCFATHSIFGPYADTMQPLEGSTQQLAVDPNGPSFFGLHKTIFTIEPETGAMTELKINGFEDQGHGAILGFDTKRHRLLLWGRDLVAVDILKKEARQVCRGNPDVRAFVYSKADDRIHAACAPYDGNSHGTVSEIRTYNHRGAELSRTKLAVPIPNADTLKMTMLSGKLLMMALGGRDGNGYFVGTDTNYVVDPETGELLFACRRRPR